MYLSETSFRKYSITPDVMQLIIAKDKEINGELKSNIVEKEEEACFDIQTTDAASIEIPSTEKLSKPANDPAKSSSLTNSSYQKLPFGTKSKEKGGSNVSYSHKEVSEKWKATLNEDIKGNKTKNPHAMLSEDRSKIKNPQTGNKRFFGNKVSYPRVSWLTKAEQHLYLKMCQNFATQALSSAMTSKELTQFKELQSMVLAEQDEYMNYLKDAAHINRQDYNHMNLDIDAYVANVWDNRIERVQKYPRFYVQHDSVPLVAPPANVAFFHIKTLLNLGTIPRMNALRKKVVLNTKGFGNIEKNIPPDYPEIAQKPVCSEDRNADELSLKHKVNIVISSSALCCLVDNHAPCQRQWELPVVVREYQEKLENGCIKKKRVVFIDKPFVPRQMTMRQRNEWGHKFTMKHKVVNNSHQANFFKHQDEYGNIIGLNQAKANRRKNKRKGNQNSEESDPDVSPVEVQGDTPFDTVDIDDLETFGTGPTKKKLDIFGPTKATTSKSIKPNQHVDTNEKNKNTGCFANTISMGNQFKSIKEATGKQINDTDTKTMGQCSDGIKSVTNTTMAHHADGINTLESNLTLEGKHCDEQSENMYISGSDSSKELQIASDNDNNMVDNTGKENEEASEEEHLLPQYDGPKDSKKATRGRKKPRGGKSNQSDYVIQNDVTPDIAVAQCKRLSKLKEDSEIKMNVFESDLKTAKRRSSRLSAGSQSPTTSVNMGSRASSRATTPISSNEASDNDFKPVKGKRGRKPKLQRSKSLPETPVIEVNKTVNTAVQPIVKRRGRPPKRKPSEPDKNATIDFEKEQPADPSGTKNVSISDDVTTTKRTRTAKRNQKNENSSEENKSNNDDGLPMKTKSHFQDLTTIQSKQFSPYKVGTFYGQNINDESPSVKLAPSSSTEDDTLHIVEDQGDYAITFDLDSPRESTIKPEAKPVFVGEMGRLQECHMDANTSAITQHQTDDVNNKECPSVSKKVKLEIDKSILLHIENSTNPENDLIKMEDNDTSTDTPHSIQLVQTVQTKSQHSKRNSNYNVTNETDLKNSGTVVEEMMDNTNTTVIDKSSHNSDQNIELNGTSESKEIVEVNYLDFVKNTVTETEGLCKMEDDENEERRQEDCSISVKNIEEDLDISDSDSDISLTSPRRLKKQGLSFSDEEDSEEERRQKAIKAQKQWIASVRKPSQVHTKKAGTRTTSNEVKPVSHTLEGSTDGESGQYKKPAVKVKAGMRKAIDDFDVLPANKPARKTVPLIPAPMLQRKQVPSQPTDTDKEIGETVPLATVLTQHMPSLQLPTYPGVKVNEFPTVPPQIIHSYKGQMSRGQTRITVPVPRRLSANTNRQFSHDELRVSSAINSKDAECIQNINQEHVNFSAAPESPCVNTPLSPSLSVMGPQSPCQQYSSLVSPDRNCSSSNAPKVIPLERDLLSHQVSEHDDVDTYSVHTDTDDEHTVTSNTKPKLPGITPLANKRNVDIPDEERDILAPPKRISTFKKVPQTGTSHAMSHQQMFTKQSTKQSATVVSHEKTGVRAKKSFKNTMKKQPTIGILDQLLPKDMEIPQKKIVTKESSSEKVAKISSPLDIIIPPMSSSNVTVKRHFVDSNTEGRPDARTDKTCSFDSNIGGQVARIVSDCDKTSGIKPSTCNIVNDNVFHSNNSSIDTNVLMKQDTVVPEISKPDNVENPIHDGSEDKLIANPAIACTGSGPYKAPENKPSECPQNYHLYQAPLHIRDPKEWEMYEDPDEYNCPMKHNVTYNLWQLGYHRVLIRCGIHLAKINPNNPSAKTAFLHLQPKLEYQSNHGYEQDTMSEVSRAWISLAIRQNCKLLKYRILAHNSDVINKEELSLEQLAQPMYSFCPQSSLHMLDGIFKKLYSLQPGHYLLGHSPGNKQAHIKKTSQSSVGVYDLHMAYKKLHINREVVPWVPVDPTKVTQTHKRFHRVPCTFDPKDSEEARIFRQSGKGLHGKKGKKKKKKQNNDQKQ